MSPRPPRRFQVMALLAKTIFPALVLAVLLSAPPARGEGFPLADLLQPAPDDTPRIERAKLNLRSNPRAQLSLFGLGHAYFEIHKYREAGRVYEYALERGYRYPQHMHTDLAIVYERLGLWDQAVDQYYRAKELVPDFFHPRYGLAYYYATRDENLEGARKMLEEITPLKDLPGTDAQQSRLEPFLWEVYGFVLLRLEEYEAAEEALLKAYEGIDPLYIGENYPSNYLRSVYNVLFHLAELYRLTGRPGQAIEYYQEIDERYRARFDDRRVVTRITARPRGSFELRRDRYLFIRMQEEWSRYDRYRYGP